MKKLKTAESFYTQLEHWREEANRLREIVDSFDMEEAIKWNMPVYSGIASIAIFASLGLPGLSGFIGEILTFLGSFGTTFYYGAKIITVVATVGLVLTAAYYLRALQKVYLGETNPACEAFPDATLREKLAMIPLVVPTILFGIYPAPLLDLIHDSVATITKVASVG